MRRTRGAVDPGIAGVREAAVRTGGGGAAAAADFFFSFYNLQHGRWCRTKTETAFKTGKRKSTASTTSSANFVKQ